MVSSLRDQSASFDFMVQLRTDPQSMPIEDPGKRWSEELSPFITVATILGYWIPSVGVRRDLVSGSGPSRDRREKSM